MGDDQKALNTELHLGLGLEDFEPKMKEENNKGQATGKSSGLSFSLLMMEEEETAIEAKLNGSSFDGWNEKKDKYIHQRDVTGFMVQSKKLRLTKEQSSLLESSFKFHNTLNPGQKQALSKQLNLKPRQVEVWFQNRRARTKLKQTESEHELLKKWCGSLSEENRRLKMELQNLGCSASLYGHQISKANTISTCPSCKTMMWPSTDESKKCRHLEKGELKGHDDIIGRGWPN